jgi:3-deoxy-manno-octulosonate cytidylyltransferase (CMP-KDO synthetase)
MRILAVIPARMAASRFPGKPLALLGGRPVVVRVWERVRQVPIFEDVVVATDHEGVIDAVRAAGGTAVLTRSDHPSGSDRVWEVLSTHDAEAVMNVQGDEPFVDPRLLERMASVLAKGEAAVVTAAAPLEGDPADPDRVKVLLGPGDLAVDFSRRAFWGSGPAWQHVGLYAYTRAALGHFVALPPSPREKQEGLEQLRLVENGVSIAVVRTDRTTVAIDTPKDLQRAERMLDQEP